MYVCSYLSLFPSYVKENLGRLTSSGLMSLPVNLAPTFLGRWLWNYKYNIIRVWVTDRHTHTHTHTHCKYHNTSKHSFFLWDIEPQFSHAPGRYLRTAGPWTSPRLYHFVRESYCFCFSSCGRWCFNDGLNYSGLVSFKNYLTTTHSYLPRDTYHGAWLIYWGMCGLMSLYIIRQSSKELKPQY